MRPNRATTKSSACLRRPWSHHHGTNRPRVCLRLREKNLPNLKSQKHFGRRLFFSRKNEVRRTRQVELPKRLVILFEVLNLFDAAGVAAGFEFGLQPNA